MTQAHKFLFDEISKLPIEKVGKVLSFIKYIEQESETELYLDPLEEAQLHELRISEDTVDASKVFEKIEKLKDD